jgi:dienelactone hydrolase
MTKHYRHLGTFSDFFDAANQQQPLYPLARPGRETQQRIREVMGFCNQPEVPLAVQVDAAWEQDGLRGEAISWSVGYGPRTQAWLLRPASANGPLPGVLALHDHGGFKFFGKEKIADGPDAPAQIIRSFRDQCYGGRAFVNELARTGFAVLVHDTFLWGSRKWPLNDMPESVQDIARTYTSPKGADDIAHQALAYNAAASPHEHLAAKYCNLFGTSMAGVVCFEDRVALNYLRSRADVDAAHVGCIGLSGGGNRAAMLTATHDAIAATVIVGLMTTYEGVLDHNVWSHTWMLYPYGLARYMDWPDLAACRAPSPLLVQYDTEDELFTIEGMRAAHERIAGHFASVAASSAYEGQFYPGPHKFDVEMQTAAFAWLQKKLGGTSATKT